MSTSEHNASEELEMTAIGREGRHEFIGVVRDKAAEVAADRAKIDFVASMSHELRSPLTSIIGISELLMGELEPERQRHFIERQHSASLVLLAMIDNFIDLSMIEVGTFELHNVSFDLRALVEACRDAVAPDAERKGLTLATKIDPEIPDHLTGDPVRLKQIMLNLLAHAIKSTISNQVALQIDFIERTAMGVRLLIRVEDSAQVLSDKKLARLYETAEELDEPAGKRISHIGLRVTISKRLIEAMGGTISADGAQVGGTILSFELTFPVAHSPIKPEAGQAKMEVRERSPRRILLAEDMEMTQTLISTVLRDAGHTVTVVSDGVEAVDAIRRGDDIFDVVLMDVQMPNMDGLAAARMIRDGERSGDHQPIVHLPIVAISANTRSPEIEQCLAAGMDRHLAKPINEAALLDAIDRMTSDSGPAVKSAPPQAPAVVPSAALDREILDNIERQIGAQRVRRLIAVFCQTLSERLPAFANSGVNANELSQHADAIVSMAKNLGFTELAYAGYLFQEVADHGQRDATMAAADELRSAALRAMVAADRVLHSSVPSTDQ